jgi:hypothetical protein
MYTARKGFTLLQPQVHLPDEVCPGTADESYPARAHAPTGPPGQDASGENATQNQTAADLSQNGYGGQGLQPAAIHVLQWELGQGRNTSA